MIAKSLVDQETGQRGYLITGKEQFLEPYELGKVQLTKHLSKLHHLVDNAYDREAMKKNMLTLKKLFSDWRNRYALPLIKQRKDIDMAALDSKEKLKRYQHLAARLNTADERNIVDNTQMLASRMVAAFKRANNQPGQTITLALARNMLSGESKLRRYLLSGEKNQLPEHIDIEELVNHDLKQLSPVD